MKRKIVKVLYQTEHDGVTTGECACCGAEVRRHLKGIDEECWECGAELDWSEEA